VSVEDARDEARRCGRHLFSICTDDNRYPFLVMNFFSGGYKVFEFYF